MGPCAWGVQFHPEVDEAIVRDWSSWTKETAALTKGYIADYHRHGAEYRGISHRLMENFLEAAGIVTAATGT
jgi:GMP synthase-like glutamine amidotransferase